MKTYEETILIVERFYNECLRFWKGDKDNALADVALLKHDPNIPNGDMLNREAVIAFVNNTFI